MLKIVYVFYSSKCSNKYGLEGPLTFSWPTLLSLSFIIIVMITSAKKIQCRIYIEN